jgi:hypothetical protein
MWADAPTRAVRITISLAGRRRARIPAGRDTWVGGPFHLTGWHTVTVAAYAPGGGRLARSSARVDMLPPSNPVFHLNIKKLDRDWNRPVP